jgi:hypothetical protein
MKRVKFVLAMCLVAAFAIGITPVPSSMADENKCPDAHSHPASKSGKVVYCECDDPLILYDGRCQYKEAIEDRLQQKIIQTLKGIKSITAAIDAEHDALLIPRVRAHFEQIAIAAGTAIVSGDLVALVPEAMSLSIDLSKALDEWTSCSAAPDLQVDCDNLRTFQKILKDTVDELIKVQKQ